MKTFGEQMKIEEKLMDNIALLTLHGNMLEPDTCELAERVKELSNQNTKNIVIDLHGIKRMNSAFGLGVLMTCYLILNRAGGELRLANLTEKEQRILEITKLDHVFQIYKNTEEAVKSF
jgi:anti-sigma B factor antagonist